LEKVSFICAAGLDNFIDPIIEGLASDYTVRKFVVRTKWDIFNAIDWGQIIFFEWANNVAVIGTNYKKIEGKKVIIRLHSYEIFTDFPKQINWDVVDRLIFVAPHIREILNELSPGIIDKVKTTIVYNGVDIDKIKSLNPGSGYNIAIVALINYKKNPPMTLQIMRELVDIDKRYILHWAGTFQDPRYQIYFDYMIKEMKLENNIKFYGYIEEMDEFWKGKNYLLSTSIHEGHPYNIMEGMIRDIKPIIHGFRGAKELYPSDLLFNTTKEAVDKITGNCYNIRGYRDWVIKNNWTLKSQLAQIKQIIEEL